MDTEINYQYCLKITVESISGLEDVPDNEIIISFYNPLNHTLYTIANIIQIKSDEVTNLKNIKCAMNLEASFEQIQSILASWSPSIQISNKSKEVLSQTYLDLNSFKLKESKESLFITTSLFDKNDKEKKIGEIKFTLTFRNCNIKVSTCEKSGNLHFLQISDELEKWKQQQKEQFKEQEYKNVKQWEKEKNELQRKLMKNIQDTNNTLQKIRTERDNLKSIIDKELCTRNIKCIHKKKPETDENEIENTLREEKKDLQRKDDQVLKVKNNSTDFAYLSNMTENMKLELYEKTLEIAYLREQWAKTTRQFNKCKKQRKVLENEKCCSTDLLQPSFIQQILDVDAAQQKKDTEELIAIKTELAKERSDKVNNKSCIIDILLKTKTYDPNDRVIKLLQNRTNK